MLPRRLADCISLPPQAPLEGPANDWICTLLPCDSSMVQTPHTGHPLIHSNGYRRSFREVYDIAKARLITESLYMSVSCRPATMTSRTPNFSLSFCKPISRLINMERLKGADLLHPGGRPSSGGSRNRGKLCTPRAVKSGCAGAWVLV